MKCPACNKQHGTLRQYQTCIESAKAEAIKLDIKDVVFE